MTPRSKAMDLLARREYGFEELCLRLSRVFEPSQAKEVVEKLREDGLQSDLRFAQALTNRRSKQGYGPNYIRRELVAKQVDAMMVDQVVSEHDWQENIMRVVGKQSHKTQEKLQKYLQYKGFDYDMIHQVIKGKE